MLISVVCEFHAGLNNGVVHHFQSGPCCLSKLGHTAEGDGFSQKWEKSGHISISELERREACQAINA